MNTQPYEAYKIHQRSDETIRETEAHALLSCASKLEDSRNQDVSRETYVEALRHNQRLWTVFQVALCEPENELPRDLKVLLLNLSRYVDKVTFRALQQEGRDLVRSLIKLNRTLAKGLQQKSEAEIRAEKAAQKQAAQPQPEGKTLKPLSTSV